jgi:hypothetical protein
MLLFIRSNLRGFKCPESETKTASHNKILIITHIRRINAFICGAFAAIAEGSASALANLRRIPGSSGLRPSTRIGKRRCAT